MIFGWRRSANLELICLCAVSCGQWKEKLEALRRASKISFELQLEIPSKSSAFSLLLYFTMVYFFLQILASVSVTVTQTKANKP